MRRAAKIDRNQPEIVRALRDVFATVQPLHTIGRGCPDLLVGFRGVNRLLEVKDGELAPSKRMLTPDEAVWHSRWHGQVVTVDNIEQALRAIGAID